MKEFIEYLVKSIVTKPDGVKVDIIENEVSEGQPDAPSKSLVIRLSVAETDMGLVIGKQGKTISALRRLIRLRNLNSHEYLFINLELVDNATGDAKPTEI